MALDPLGKAILETLMDPPISVNTVRMYVQHDTGCTAHAFWQRMESLEMMKMVEHLHRNYAITPKGRAFYLADGVVDSK
jgi:hypothetical protein